MHLAFRLAIVSLAILPLCIRVTQAAPRDSNAVVKTTVCEIVSHPKRFNGKTVRFEALVNSHGIERTVLMNSSCAEAGIALMVVTESEGARRLREAIFPGRPGTIDKQIRGVFTGTFKWKRKEVPSRILVLQSATDIKVER